MRRLQSSIYIIASIFFFCAACKHEAVVPDKDNGDNYPEDISRIIQTSCVAGCHNAANYTASGGNLLMDTWEHLFDGGGHGAAVVPYSISNSPLLYFINDTLSPDVRMPYQLPALSKDDQATLRNWIARGAPDKNGNIPFATNAETRQKIYVLHNSCNGVAVIDAEKQVIMRYIPVGKNYTAEQGRGIKVSPDGRYVYVSFYSGDYIQKIDTRTDTVIAELNTGHAYWQQIAITADGNQLAIPDWRNHEVTMIGTGNMQVTSSQQGFSQPHGVVFGKDNTLYVTAQNGNMVYKIYQGIMQLKSLERGKAPYANPAPNVTALEPHEIIFSPDQSKYFVSCQKTNEVRVMDAATDQLIDSIKVGAMPQAMAVSKTRPYIFVTCREEETGNSNTKGAVYAINYETLAVQKINGRFYQPRGMAVDDQNGKLYVISRNIATTGVKPHHGSGSVFCNGNNGFYTIIDLNTLKEVNARANELTVDPYAAGVRF